jgi:hypothetical protein
VPRGTKKQKQKPKIRVTTIVFTETEKAILQRVSRQASDEIGRAISMSGVLRALVSWLNTQDATFVREEIIPIIAKELSLLRWGRKKES